MAERNSRKKFKTSPDTVYLKVLPDVHPLSVEQQIFFVKVTEGIFGYNESIRNECLKGLSMDANVIHLMPYLSRFIMESIHRNIASADLTLLIYTVRMTRSILNNPHLYLAPFLHEIIPAILSCGLARKICKHYYDNHWTLRDFSANTIFSICEKYNNTINNITKRIIAVYMKPFADNLAPLTTVYGATKGLATFGDEVVTNCIMPNLLNMSLKLQLVFEQARNYYAEERAKKFLKEAKHARDCLVAAVAPVLLKTNNVNDGGLLYARQYGYLGRYLYAEVKNLERQDGGGLVAQFK